jgi:ABC-type molybdenum transport system ATPase subunit/photorepair protein PhrA
MPTSAEGLVLCPLRELRARLTPGALLFALAEEAQAAGLREELRREGLAWVGWSQRQAFMQAWRPAAQERYSSMAGRDAPALRDWLSPQFQRWHSGEGGVSALRLDEAGLASAMLHCGLEGLASRPVSLLSNGESARACLAGALAQEPEVLVLQDLAEGLDAPGRRLLLEVGQGLASRGRAVLFLASRPSLFPQAQISEPARLAPAPDRGGELFCCQALALEAGDRPLLSGLDWTILGGEAWRLRGANGRGKSTLLAYLSGEHPQAWARSWSLLAEGRQAYTPLERLRASVAWVSPELTAVAKRPILDLLDGALRGPARLLLLDEVLRGLDAKAVSAWQQRLCAWLGPDKALVFVCHDPLEAPACLNRSLDLDELPA